ncbi:lipopolysaccharide biosynthesis protein [Desulfatitalea alkaliphila]|uniref:Lipopolysaccharide biosynthesis protein n=1 Tax=Desulfatitalea alkaliphila TaxID=2929485 RepID=A0AA41R381_9BACT|nr:lipopolysaccharide biosynthesis protein [Desulfatitalea alkaliphila]MCJ8502099.1 lipopolysaccharide biosynthesis protein [Desulfatitalea alkaliphila]
MNLKQKVMSGLAWSASGRLLAQLITWCITIVIIRLLSPEDYGLMALAGVFVAFLALLNELGLGAAIVQRKHIDNSTLSSLFGLVLLVGTLFYLIMFFSAPLIAEFYNDHRLVSLVKVLALEFMINSFAVIPRAQLLRDMKFRQIAIVDFSSAISGSVLTLILALMGYGVWALVWGTLTIRIISTLGFNISQPIMYLPRISMRGMKSFVIFGGYVTVGRILWYLYSNADTLIIGKMLGKDLLGFYSVGLMLATMPMEKVSGIINQVAFPAFSSVQTDIELVGRHFLKAVRVMSFITFPVLWGISSISPEIIQVFLSEKWLQAVVPMQIIALIIPLRMISNLMSTAVFGVGRADVSFMLVVIPSALLPIAFFVGSHWGLLGVSLSWLLVFPFVFTLQILLTIRVLKVAFLSIFKAISMPLISGAVMYGSVFFIRSLSTLDINILQMLLLIFSGALSYMIITLVINRFGLREVANLVKN